MNLKKKKILLIWDFDGPIGQINSTLPYNYSYDFMVREIENVRWLLETLKSYHVRCCFAITGLSAEPGTYPYHFPELIQEIASHGHEIASHSWKHEWIPLFTKAQIQKSLEKSKVALELASNGRLVTGFIPPHNRPMTWIKKGSYSLGDRGLWPFFPTGDLSTLIQLLKATGYKWVRISHKSPSVRFGIKKHNITGTIFNDSGIMILYNHYTGFDKVVREHIRRTSFDTYTISAHPSMLSLTKNESRHEFLQFMNMMKEMSEVVEFVAPSNLMTNEE